MKNCHKCYLCQSEGDYLYQGLKDRLYKVSGEWNLKKCRNIDCGLVWLDPCPTSEEINKLYEKDYYTHGSHQVEEQIKDLKYWSNFNLIKYYNKVYGKILNWGKILPERLEVELMCIKDIPVGKLLEIGSGDGSRLSKLQALGWEVQGQEIDVKATKIAQETYQVPVYLGSLDSAHFTDNSFDVIVMNHVIEHVQDPIALVRECNRLLKSGGIFMAITPNVQSHNHQKFGSNWLGLQPPTHLHLFNQKNLNTIATLSGFREIQTRTTAANAEVIAFGSLELKEEGYHQLGTFNYNFNHVYRYIRASLLQLKSSLIYLIDKNSGEECILKAIK